jgi:hypothetical protein
VPPLQRLEDLALNPDALLIYSSVKEACAHLFDALGLEWAAVDPRTNEVGVRTGSEEIYIVFRLQQLEESSVGGKRLVITHAAVPKHQRRTGIFSRTVDELVETLQPDEIEINRILSDGMRHYAISRGYALAPGDDPMSGSYRLAVDGAQSGSYRLAVDGAQS